MTTTLRRLAAAPSCVVLGAYVRGRRIRLVDRRRPRPPDGDRATARLRRPATCMGALRQAAVGVQPRSLRRVALPLARVVAQARSQLLPRPTVDVRASGVRRRLRETLPARRPHRPRAGDARGDARARDRRGRRRGQGLSHSDRDRPRAISARRRRGASQRARKAGRSRLGVRRRIVREGRRRSR